jgi:1-deoxy-D-xylulose-5-phosphate synthase
VVFCLDRAGLVGEDGATHHGVFDLTYLRAIPYMMVFAPRNEMELRNIMYTAQLGLKHPIAIRYPRGRGITVDWKTSFSKIDIGRGVNLKQGKDIAVLSVGSIAKNVTEALEALPDVAHYDMRFIKPLDENLLHKVFKKYSRIMTVEDGIKKGGFGSAVLEFASENDYNTTVEVLGIEDTFTEHGSIEELQKMNGIDADSIRKKLTL